VIRAAWPALAGGGCHGGKMLRVVRKAAASTPAHHASHAGIGYSDGMYSPLRQFITSHHLQELYRSRSGTIKREQIESILRLDDNFGPNGRQKPVFGASVGETAP